MIIRQKRPFFTVSNSVIEDSNISAKTKWLMVCISYLLEQTGKDELLIETKNLELLRLCELSNDDMELAIDELALFGYVDYA